jgi:hypothetical protein
MSQAHEAGLFQEVTYGPVTGLQDANCKVWLSGDDLWYYRVFDYADPLGYSSMAQALWSALIQLELTLLQERREHQRSQLRGIAREFRAQGIAKP